MIALVAALLPTTLFQQEPSLYQLWRMPQYKAMRQGSHNPDDASNDDSRRLPAGGTLTLLDTEGPGMVTHLWLTIADNEYGWPRLLRLRMYWDGNEKPSVDVPLGDFFAVGHGLERDVASQPVRCTSLGRAKNCYWPMPFAKHARITLTNEGSNNIQMTYFQVDWRKYESLPEDTLYFHAHYRQESPAKPGNYVLLDTKGMGQYVGTVLSVIPRLPGWFGEGDEYFYVDGEKEASLKGTGTEDYINDAWGFRELTGPYYGVTSGSGFDVGDRVSAYKWHIADPVPFQDSLRVEIEHKGWVFKEDGSLLSSFMERDDEFSSVAYWYQTPPRTDLPDLPLGKARLPYGNALTLQAEAQLDKVTAKKGKAELQKEVFWHQDIVFFPGQREGAELTIPFDVPDDGKYEVLPLILSSYDYGIYEALLDGKKVGGRMNLYSPNVTMPKGYPLGRPELKKGTHTLTFKCVGKDSASGGHYFGIDQIVLSRVK